MKDRSRLQYNVHAFSDAKNSGPKARRDTYQILKNNGFEDLYNSSSPLKAIRIARRILAISRLKEEQLLFVQYPLSHRAWCRYLSMFKSTKKACIIHDLESIRYWKINSSGALADEIAALSQFSCVISQNARMTAFLKESGLKTPIVDLCIFDCLMDKSLSVSGDRSRQEISFAGNLEKAPFVSQLANIEGVKFLLYGEIVEGLDASLQPGKVEWCGAFSTDEIPAKVSGGWGLVWDGDSVETCSGVFGEYLRYNSPHKASMYIVAERPVIIWREAAIASYIIEKGLGIAVSSLHELPSRIAEVSDEAYTAMLSNVRKEKKQLIAGKNLEEALAKALAILEKS